MNSAILFFYLLHQSLYTEIAISADIYFYLIKDHFTILASMFIIPYSKLPINLMKMPSSSIWCFLLSCSFLFF
jgi:hypothetical protein